MYPAHLLSVEDFYGIYFPLLQIKINVAESSFNNDEMKVDKRVSINFYSH